MTDVVCVIFDSDGYQRAYVLDDGRVIESSTRPKDSDEDAADYLMLLRDYGEA